MAKKVLIIEDDAMISGMYKTRLEQEGYAVVTADNGGQGLEVAVIEKPDLILLDVMMPMMDGFALLQELRLKSTFKETPIIMLTNLGTTEDKEKGEKFGATDYLVKANLTPSKVSEHVAKYLK
ncbi:response regulator [Candidatus Parcubacteria bacterium]|nr:MAG: response regulator [Candidatus Parcubacteria bacterium]